MRQNSNLGEKDDCSIGEFHKLFLLEHTIEDLGGMVYGELTGVFLGEIRSPISTPVTIPV
jgi:hypothetical protein